jgi:hypothetical protein
MKLDECAGRYCSRRNLLADEVGSAWVRPGHFTQQSITSRPEPQIFR